MYAREKVNTRRYISTIQYKMIVVQTEQTKLVCTCTLDKTAQNELL